MKMPALMASLALALGVLASPAAAQDGQASDAPAVRTCALLTSAVELAELEAAEVAEGLLAGQISLELVPTEDCAVTSSGQDAEAAATVAGTPYVEFVARGAGAAIELAALAERHEGARTLAALDRAAKDVHDWAGGQRKWLDRHPPQACYADAHAQWRAGVVDVREGAKDVRRAIKRLQAAPVERAVRELSSGAAKLTGLELDAFAQACLGEAGS